MLVAHSINNKDNDYLILDNLKIGTKYYLVVST